MPYLNGFDTESYSAGERKMADIDVEDVLARLTLKEKVMLTAGRLVAIGLVVLSNRNLRQ